MRPLLHDLALAAAGYVVAVAVATAVCLIILFGLDFAADPAGFGLRAKREFLWISLFALFITAMTAWPGFIAALAIARQRHLGSVPYFSLCGVATAVLAVLLFALFERDPSLARGLAGMPVIYLGGLAGGFAYALFARRFRIFA